MNTSENSLIQAMQQPAFYNYPVASVELIETHISWVLLTGRYAYKIKKPVDFGFLDFTTLEKRKYYCEEELRLNGRLAPDIYLDVIAIAESNGTFSINHNKSNIVEYAVRMQQFSQQGLIRNLLQNKQITIHHIKQLADAIAEFHDNIAITDKEMIHGDPTEVIKPVEHNFTILEEFITEESQRKTLALIKQKSQEIYERIQDALLLRKKNGFIRECHGDLHLGNIAFINGNPLIFDGIEFSESLRWIDVISEIAFLIMDLEDYDQPYFATTLLNRYLEKSGDYAGLEVFQFYKIYRAMVRAKVTALRLQQETENSERFIADSQKLNDYLELAKKYCEARKPFMIVTHGISGSGKSWIGNQLAAQLNAIIIHSDHERKRLFENNTDNLYSRDITSKTYQYLQDTAQQLLTAGYPVIVDATFLDKTQRDHFYSLGQQLAIRFYILHCHADKHILEQRIKTRCKDKTEMSDADIAIMQNQLDRYQPLDVNELKYTIEFDSNKPIDLIKLAEKFTS
ncbi:MAG TPA: AAA family ATPase [Gammaproteobacteria bacterium]